MIELPAIDEYLPGFVPGGDPLGAEGPPARQYVDELREALAKAQAAGATGQELNRANSDATDRLIRRLYERAESSFYAETGELGARIAVTAVGGFARREMSIGSDVDLLFLQDSEQGPLSAHVAERIQTALWDAGLQVGAALRTVEETIALGRDDVSACTAILVARFLAGDPTVFHELTTATRDQLIPDLEAFVVQQRDSLEERRARYGESLYLLQPNVKEGAGGLRDYHAAYWVARATNPLMQELGDLLHVGLLTEGEMAEYKAALQFLWRVRNQLHLLGGRKTDQMSFELQEALADVFGYGGDDGGLELPVERFMQEYYRHARAIRNLSEIVIEQCLARTRPRRGPVETIAAEDGFRVAVGDHLEIPHSAHLRERPVRLLGVFAVAQDHEVPLSRTARRLVREQLHLIDDDFRRDPEASALLMRILGSETRVMRSLMAMNEVGLLGSYLPEWDHIVCRWQHVIYHTYTVDVHSIFLVEELRRLWRGKYEAALPEMTELVRQVPDLPALFLGCLLHDIGKGLGGDHSNKGVRLAEPLLERLGIDPERSRRIVFIVHAHLLMSRVAQRRDLSDPRVIVEFARLVGDRENLHNLYLATFADMRASSSQAWTEWRYELIRELFERTSEFLETGQDDPARAAEQVEARVETRKEKAEEELRGLGLAESRIASFYDMMPRRYFTAHSPRQIARHALVLFSFGEDQRVATAVREMRGGFSELIVVTPDVHGLYGNVAGTLAALDINILGSHVYSTKTGLALEVYRLTTPSGGDEERRAAWERLDATLEQVMAGEVDVAALLARRGRPVGHVGTPSRKPPEISIRNDVSDFYTVVDITANDRLGLLYDLARTISDHDLEIFLSKASTVLDQVADTFYLKTGDKKKLNDPEALARLEAALRAVVTEPGAAPASG